MSSEENKILNLVLAELKDTKAAVKDAVARMQDDIEDIYFKLVQFEVDIKRDGVSIEKLKDLEDFKKKVQEILTYDDMKKMKEEREASGKFRAIVTAYAVAYASIISFIISLAVKYFFKWDHDIIHDTKRYR